MIFYQLLFVKRSDIRRDVTRDRLARRRAVISDQSVDELSVGARSAEKIPDSRSGGIENYPASCVAMVKHDAIADPGFVNAS